MISGSYKKLKADAQIKGAGLHKQLICPDSSIYIYCGYDSPRNEVLLIIEISEDSAGKVVSLPKIQGLKYAHHHLGDESDKCTSIIIAPTSVKFEESFIVLVEDLVAALEPVEKKEIMRTLSARLNIWRKFFSSKPIGQLSAEKQRGLWGELYMMKKLVQANSSGVSETVKAWRGPYDAAQDYIFHERLALEVKSKAPHEPVRISSEFQLDDSELEQLWLAVVSMKSADDGLSLNAIVDEVKDLLSENEAALSNFDLGLVQYGYLEVHRKLYDFPGYAAGGALYRVEESFPRICLADVREGVGGVKYSIAATAIADFEQEFNEFNSEVTGL